MVIFFPLTLAAIAVSTLLMLLLLLLDKLHPSKKILASFYIKAFKRGEQAEMHIVHPFAIQQEVEIRVDIPEIGLFAGHKGIVEDFDGKRYLVKINMPDGICYSSIDGENLHRI